MWLDAALRSERPQEEERGKRETPIHQTLSERTVEQQTRRHLHIRGFCPSLPDKLIKSRDDDAQPTRAGSGRETFANTT